MLFVHPSWKNPGSEHSSFCVADGRDTFVLAYYFFVQKLRQFECLPGIKFQGLHPVELVS